MTGRYFKLETLGAVDGPGLRLVLFLQGCPLRCPYCHNPEGWPRAGGQSIGAQQVLDRLRRYERYYRGGGLTISGGEPLMQAPFVRELLARCRQAGIHTALDTAACVQDEQACAAMDEADLLLLDIKHADPKEHERIFGFSQDAPLAALRRREALGRPVWIRQVIAPGYTDAPAQADALRALLAPFSCVQKVELLPFHKLCAEKYEQLGIPFPMGEGEEEAGEDETGASGGPLS